MSEAPVPTHAGLDSGASAFCRKVALVKQVLSMSFDFSEYMGAFMDEAEEQLSAISQGLLQLEANPEDSHTLQEIFRASHSLKGASASMNFTAVSNLSHHMENLLDELRNRRIRASEAIIDLLLESSDMLRLLINEISSDTKSTSNPESLMSRIQYTVEQAAAQADPSPPVTADQEKDKVEEPDSEQLMAEALQQGKTLFNIAMSFMDNLPMKELKVFLVMQNLASLVDVISTEPDQTNLSQDSLESGFTMVVATDAGIEDLTECCKVGGVTDVRITPYGSDVAEEQSVQAPSALSPVPDCDLPLVEEVQEMIGQAWLDNRPVYHLHVFLKPSALMHQARIYLIYNNLRRAGEVFASDPGSEALEEGEIGKDIAIVLATDIDVAAIEKVCDVTDFDHVDITPICPVEEEIQAEVAENDVEEEIEEADIEPDAEAVPEEREADPVAIPVPVAKEPPRRDIAPVPPTPQRKPMIRHETIRVDIRKLDRLMNLVGELITGRSVFSQISGDLRSSIQDLKARGSNNAFMKQMWTLQDKLQDSTSHLDHLSSMLQECVVEVRMLPIGQVFNRFPRMVRDLSHELGKNIRLEIHGESTELDRGLIEEIGDPLIHLIRNSVDHGIESIQERRDAGKSEEAHLQLIASQQGNQIVIEVRDDGRGIDPEAVRQASIKKGIITESEAALLSDSDCIELLFKAGVSTSSIVTDVSGRGVGLDVVRENVEHLSGTISVENTPGEGASFIIRLPLTLSIMPALIARSAGTLYAIPLATVDEIYECNVDDIQRIRGREVISLRDDAVVLESLPSSPGFRSNGNGKSERLFIIVITTGQRRIGVPVESLVGQKEVVIKPVGRYLRNVPGLTGATLMGDGSIALVMDILGYVRRRTAESHAET
jgi:two-component system, chemotaxis family, sensor kinase CheA